MRTYQNLRHVICWLVLAMIPMGCRRGSDAVNVAPAVPATAESHSANDGDAKPAEPELPAMQTYEASAEELLAARLSSEEVAEGWIRLFDGHTLLGWEIAGDANFRVEQGSIVVDSGSQCLMCTSMPWKDYELVVEFKAGPETNSGVFLRTPLNGTQPATNCYEVNIAPDDNPFPTAGVVQRLKATSTQPQVFDQWRTMTMRLEGPRLQVSIDDQRVTDYTDPEPLAAGRIGLQHNSGRVEFRSVKLRPLGMQSLLDAELSQWTKYPQMPGEFTVTSEGWLHVQGGRTQLESKESFGDFVLFAEYKLPKAELNSGIFFRCIPGDEMMGYECQVSNEMKDGNPLIPADHGTGGIFRRQEARFVAGEVDQWAGVVLAAHGPHFAAWVNGVQVTDYVDDREPDVNPRRGRRTDPGTIMIQGHDPSTDATFKQIQITSIGKVD